MSPIDTGELHTAAPLHPAVSVADVNIHELARVEVHVLWSLEAKDHGQHPDIDSFLSLVR